MAETARTQTHSLSEQAAEWAVCMSGEDVSVQQQADFEAWLAQDKRHREAYAEVEALWHSITPKKRRKYPGIKSLLVVAILFGCLYSLAFSVWLSDERTGTGEIRHIALPDGSYLILDSNSAVDIEFDAGTRRVILHRGRLLAEVEPVLSNQQPPFIVETRDGTAKALGTRYIVEQTGVDSAVTVVESQVAVATRANPSQYATVQEGQVIRFGGTQLHQPEKAAPFAASWTQSRLTYHDVSLETVINDLARYRSGYLSVHAQTAQLRFTGVLPSNDTDAALTILENALPIRVSRYGGWVVRIHER